MLFSINKYNKYLRLKTALPSVSPACPQECMFDTKIPTCSSKQGESCTSELDAGRRRMPALYPFLSKEVRGVTGRKVEMQPVDQAARRSCHANTCDELAVPSRHSWMCSLHSRVRTGAASPSCRLDEEPGFHRLQLECSMLPNPLLLSLGSQLRGGSWCCNLTGLVEFSSNINSYTIEYIHIHNKCNLLFSG